MLRSFLISTISSHFDSFLCTDAEGRHTCFHLQTLPTTPSSSSSLELRCRRHSKNETLLSSDTKTLVLKLRFLTPQVVHLTFEKMISQPIRNAPKRSALDRRERLRCFLFLKDFPLR